MQNIDR